MRSVSIEKPGTPEELVHFGVAGMKWGVRRSRESRAFRKKFATRAERDLEITRARASAEQQKAAIAKAGKDTEKGHALAQAYLRHPDRATARRLKSGEKVVLALTALLVPGVGPVTVTAAAGVNATLRRGIEDANTKRSKQ